jgi:hypothetical protein
MKTTLEIPDAIFRKAKAVAAERGVALRVFVTEAVEEKLAAAPKKEQKPKPFKVKARAIGLPKEWTSGSVSELLEMLEGPGQRRSNVLFDPAPINMGSLIL